MCDDSKTVRILTVKGLRHARQFQRPGRVVFPLIRVASPMVPQCGHSGPFGQSRASTYSMAASSLAKCATLNADFMAESLSPRHSRCWVCYVKCNVAE